MKPNPIPLLSAASALFMPLLHAQDSSAKLREIEQKVLLEQHQSAIQAIVGSAREGGEAGPNPEIVGKRLQWLAMVDTQIAPGGKAPAVDTEEMIASAGTLNELAWSMITSPDAARRHPDIALKLADLAIELGGENEDLKPKVLDTKARALFLLGKPEEAIAQQEKAVTVATADEKAGFEATLAAYRKGELPEVPSRDSEPEPIQKYGAPPPSRGVEVIMKKLREIIIPVIDFEDVTLDQAVDFLRKKAVELDTTELDPSRKGVNFVIRRPVASSTPASTPSSGETPPHTTVEPDAVGIKSLHLRNIPLAVALKYICDSTGLRFKVDDYAVHLVDANLANNEIFTRSFIVPPDFSSILNSDSKASPLPIVELLKSVGITFGEGCAVFLNPSGVLLVTNTPNELDKIEQLIQVTTNKSEWKMK